MIEPKDNRATRERNPAALAGEVRDRMGPPAPLREPPPLVSIVVTSHNGVDHLRTLIGGLVAQTNYPEVELIAVDNGSADESLAYLRSVAAPFPITIVANVHNESFSDANNRGAALASGDMLLFLNNDVELFESGWLLELVGCLQRWAAGAVGATLVFPHKDVSRYRHGYAVQHRGLTFRDESGLLGPALHGWEDDPLDEQLGQDLETPVVVAACLLVETALYHQVGGFTHGYVYGQEDIDFGLKIRGAGLPVVCSGRSIAIHRSGSTRKAVPFEEGRDRKLRNRALLQERWGPRLRRQHDLDAVAGGGIWVQAGREDGAAATSEAQAWSLGVCVKAGDAPPIERIAGDDAASALAAAAAERSQRTMVLRGTEVEDLRGLNYDIAIHVRGATRYIPKEGQLNVLWVVDDTAELTRIECALYDLVASSDERLAARLEGLPSTAVAVTDGTPGAVVEEALAMAEARERPRTISASPAYRAGVTMSRVTGRR